MTTDPTDLYLTPASEITAPDERTEDLPLATRGERFGASLIDGIILGLLSAALGAAYMFLPDRYFPEAITEKVVEITTSHWGGFIDALMTFLIFVIIQGHFLAETGQTLGKKLLGIKIVTLEGAKPRMEALLVRRALLPGLLGAIPEAGPYLYLAGILIIFCPSRRCLHDYCAGTKVVQAKGMPKGIIREKAAVPVRVPELILAAIIRQRLDIEPHSLTEATSWAGDLGMPPDKIHQFHEEVARRVPATANAGTITRTYGDLLALLDIPLSRMMRVPAKISHRAPAFRPPRRPSAD